jgi:hypothetical protein
MDHSDWIRIYEKALDPNVCKNAILKFDTNSDQQVRWDKGVPQFNVINLSHESDNGDHEWGAIQNQIISVIQWSAQEYMRAMDCEKFWAQKNNLEQIKMNKYIAETNDSFALHIDVGDVDSARRFLAYKIFLNDVEEGGEMEFPQLDLKIRPGQGDVVVYPPGWTFPYQDNAPVNQDKYELTTYLHYQ